MAFFYTNVAVHRGSVYCRGYDTSGEMISKKVNFQPTIFIPSTEEESDGWKTIHGSPVKPIKMNSINEMVEYAKGNFNVCGLTSAKDQRFAFINAIIPGDVVYKKELIKKMIIDIEIETEGGYPDPGGWENPFQKINAITIWEEGIGYITWGLGNYTNELDAEWEYRRFDDELEMMHDFFKFVQHEKPDIISGWNVDGFDIPYICNRISFLGHKEWTNLLSPWKFVPEIHTDKTGERTLTIPGLTVLDYMRLYKKFCMTPRESYSLNSIAHAELGEKKTDYSEFDSLQDLYKRNWNLFCEYNKRDVYLVKKLDDKMKFFDLATNYAYLGKVNFEDVFGTVKYWDIKIYNELFLKKIAVPNHPPVAEQYDFVGGYVKDPQVGMHRWMSSFDLDSLYPNLIVQYNMSPETILDHVPEKNDYIEDIIDGTFDNSDLLKKNVVMTANGVYFSKEKQGFIPEIIEKIYAERKSVKQEMIELEKKLQVTKVGVKEMREKVEQLNSHQYVLKIALNSLFGGIANKHFRYYDIRIASAITMTGQAVVRRCERNTNRFMNKILKTDKDYVIAIDTDSVFVCMEDLIDKYCPDQTDVDKVIDIMDKISAQKILPMMNKGFDELFVYLNGYKSRMNIKRESLSSKAIFLAKKKYVMYVYNNEGVKYAEPKLKIKGLEIVRSSTPEICREAIKKGVKIIFDEGESATQSYIKEFREKFINSSADAVAFPRGINDLEKWVDNNGRPKTGMPMHVTAAYNFNMMIDKLSLNKKYEKIKSGEKVKFIYLKKPNPVQSHTIAFPSLLPKELGIDEYIDYDVQFEKAFLSPIKSIMDVIGWQTEKKTDLTSLFG